MKLYFFYIRFLLFLLIFIFISGCAKTIMLDVENISAVTHKQEKNYIIGETREVNVGDAMIKFQDYFVETTYSSIMSPDSDVVLSAGIVTIALKKGGKYPVLGQVTIDHNLYTVVSIDNVSYSGMCVLVNEKGCLYNKVINRKYDWGNDFVMMIYEFNISNHNVKMVRNTGSSPVQGKPFRDYELLYTGVNGNSLNLTYREYTPDGLARTAFFQNLTYKADSKYITFKNYKIYVQSATSDSIVFTVMSD